MITEETAAEIARACEEKRKVITAIRDYKSYEWVFAGTILQCAASEKESDYCFDVRPEKGLNILEAYLGQLNRKISALNEQAKSEI